MYCICGYFTIVGSLRFMCQWIIRTDQNESNCNKSQLQGLISRYGNYRYLQEWLIHMYAVMWEFPPIEFCPKKKSPRCHSHVSICFKILMWVISTPNSTWSKLKRSVIVCSVYMEYKLLCVGIPTKLSGQLQSLTCFVMSKIGCHQNMTGFEVQEGWSIFKVQSSIKHWHYYYSRGL
jgi:hypothetical protein